MKEKASAMDRRRFLGCLGLGLAGGGFLYAAPGFQGTTRNGGWKAESPNSVYVITDDCICCGDCKPECPVQAISEGEEKYSIDPKKCTSCGDCVKFCPVEAIQLKKDTVPMKSQGSASGSRRP